MVSLFASKAVYQNIHSSHCGQTVQVGSVTHMNHLCHALTGADLSTQLYSGLLISITRGVISFSNANFGLPRAA